MKIIPLRAVAFLTACLAGLLTGSIALAAPSFTFGPIVGRGETPDKMIVKWGTSASGATTLYYRKKGETTWLTASGATGADHEVTLTALAASTSYEYAFDNTGAAFATTATCPAPGSPMDVVFYGDSRPPFLGTSQHPAVIAAVTTAVPDLVINSGDLSLAGTAAEMLGNILPQIAPIAKSTPYMSAPGNHETTLGYAGNFDRFFPTPRGDGEAWRAYYAFSCGNATFLVLDSNHLGDATQKTFITTKLAAAAADTNIDHVFVNFHHAPYSVGTHGDDTGVQSGWVPLFDGNAKVRLVFSGHDHLYGRFNNGSQVAYVVSGGAGADLYADTGTSSAMKVTSKSAYNYVLVHIAGKSVSLKAVDVGGTTLDTLDVGPPPAPDLGGADMASSSGDDAGPSGSGGDAGLAPGAGRTPMGGCAYAGPPQGAPAGALVAVALLAFGLSRRRRVV